MKSRLNIMSKYSMNIPTDSSGHLFEYYINQIEPEKLRDYPWESK